MATMTDKETYVLETGSSRDRKKGKRLSALHPRWLRNDAAIARAARHAHINDKWIALSETLAAKALKAAAEAGKKLGMMVVLDHVAPPTAVALMGIYDAVVTFYQPRNHLPLEEMAEVLRAANADELFISGAVDKKSKTVTLWRGNGRPLVVPMSTFQPSGSGIVPDFDRFAVCDFGHTLRFGDYEAAADAVLYEHDSSYRRKAKQRLIQTEQGFGAALRRVRLQKGLKRSNFEPLAAKTIARIERGEIGKPQEATLQHIANKLGIEAEEIETY